MTDTTNVSAATDLTTKSVGRFNLRDMIQQASILPILLILIIAGTFVSDVFLSKANMINILQQSAVLAIVVVAATLVLLVGRFDLSVESVVGLAPITAAALMASEATGGYGVELNAFWGFVIALSVGALVGAINGFFVVKIELNAFILTLAMLVFLRGVALGIGQGKTMYDLPEAFIYLGLARIGGVPVSIIVAGLVIVGGSLFLRYHRIGRSMYAIGGNAEAARAAGINVDRIIFGTFVVAGILAALAGIILTGRIASATAGQGTNLIFSVMAAAVIGGVSLNGGRGTLLGAMLGVLLLGLVQNILVLAQVATYWIDATFGAIIVLALVMARFTSGKSEV